MAGVRISEVAKKAGVSKTTVSFVLNSSGAVGEATRQRVLSVIRELGYEPSPIARSLRTRYSETIGMLVPDLFGPYFFALFGGAEEVLAHNRYVCYLGNANEHPDQEDRYLRSLLRRSIDGLLLAPLAGRGSLMLKSLAQVKLPTVFVDRGPEVLGLAEDAYPSVSTANRQAAEDATTYLVSRAGGPVALVSPDASSGPIWLRRQGYRTAVIRAGQEPLESIGPGDSKNAGRTLMSQLLDRGVRPAAVFATTNPCGLGVYLALRERGLHPPEGVRLVVFDDADWADVAGVTVVRTDPHRIGGAAASALLQILRGGRLLEPRITIPAELVVRGSS